MNFFKLELFLINLSEFGRKSLLNMGLRLQDAYETPLRGALDLFRTFQER